MRLRPFQRLTAKFLYGRALLLLVVAIVTASSVLVGIASAEESQGQVESPVTPALIQEAVESPEKLGNPPTDLKAADELPHHELERGEALRLLDSVFGAEVEEPAGIFDNLEVDGFLSDHAAVITTSESTAPEPALLESTLPLRTEAPDGEKVPVDLSLERSEGELTPVAPLVEAEIPGELGEGISLGSSEIGIEFVNDAEQRAPSNVEGESAFYPNVQADTDLLVAPIPTGVETWTQLRTPQSPTSQTFHLDLPPEAELKETPLGGAEATLNGRTLLTVPPATAVDAAGSEVPVSMSTEGHDLEIEVSPGVGTEFPILVDPTFQEESWNWIWGSSNFSSWYPYHTDPSYLALTYGYPATENHAIDMTSGFSGSAGVMSRAEWSYYVPRYFSDMAEYGKHPESFISSAKLEAAMFLLQGNSSVYPVEDAGIIDETKGEWVTVATHRGNEGEVSGWSGSYSFPNWGDEHARIFSFQLVTLESEAQAKYRTALAGEATVTVGDHNAPEITELSPPGGWYNEPAEAPSIGYSISDPGLGVYELQTETWTTNGTPGVSKSYYKVGCVGVASNPCPQTETSSKSPHPWLIVAPKNMPEGRDTVTVKATDPLGAQGFPAPQVGGSEETYPHITAKNVQVKVDHSAPTLSPLSGTVTEQATLGTSKPRYTLKYSATDGTEEPPTLSGTGSMGTFSHPADIALDGAEKRWIADENNNRIVKTNEAGEVLASYSAVGSTDSLSHPTGIDVDASGNIWVVDSGHNRIVKFNSKGEWLLKIGKAGSGNSEFSAPTGIAVGANGNVWVADTGNNRVEELSSTGSFLGAFGSKGAGNGQFLEPSGIDVGPGNNVWVTDTGNNRIVELSEKGEFLAAYGSLGSGNGQLNHPTGIDVDTRGSVWVVDQNNGRVEQFSERGEYLGKFGSAGAGEGQFTFTAPAGITSNTAGTLWVADSGNNRISRWNAPKGTRSGVRKVTVKVDGKVVQEPSVTCPQGGCPLVGEWTLRSGEYEAGPHTVEVSATDGVGLTSTRTLNITLTPPAPTVTLSGTLTEQGTLGTTRPRYRLKVSSSAEEGTGVAPSGPPAYMGSFGASGSGEGQLSHPAGIATDAEGNLWVADTSNNRIEGFNSSGEFLRSVGSAGAGTGQFSRPTAIAVDSQGEFWVADSGNNRLQVFGPSWEYVKTVGASGSGNGQFNDPEGLAIDSKGNVWVADTHNYRVQELSSKGSFVKVVPGLGSIEPTALAANPFGEVWIADPPHNRVVDYMDSLNISWSVGSEGSGKGLFKHPDAIAIDSSLNVWVGDEGNGRVQELSEGGEYIAQFGSAGSGPGQFTFTAPMGLVVRDGNLWVSDTGGNRVERWRQAYRSRVTSEVTLDGKRVNLGEAACAAETCPIAREWTLASSAYAPGQHTLVAKATDGYGQWTSKTRTIEIQRDTTKPALQVGGELANAPEGWVQQESYGFNASATDEKGYGVTSLTFRIDGTAVLSKTQACSEGNCSASISGQVNMAPYSGGAHEAEVVATDGAGNSSTKRWTINVDPEGHISTAEATATAEAAEDTGSANLVGESKEEVGFEGTAPGLGLESTSSGFAAIGSLAPTEISSTESGSMTVEIPAPQELYGCSIGEVSEEPEPEEVESAEEVNTPESACSPFPGNEPTELVPVSIELLEPSASHGTPGLVEENAVVIANSQPEVDTATRPLSDGGMIFEDIRDSSGPEQFSYRVSLTEEEEIRQIDEKDVEVFQSGGFPSFTITAKPASDAIGTAVPTSIEKTGRDIVTLTVHHRTGHEGQPFVYPVVGGSGWEGGFKTVEVDMDNPPEEPSEIEESEMTEEGLNSEATIMGNYKDVVYGPPKVLLRRTDNTEIKERPYNFHECRFAEGPKVAPEGAPPSPLPPKERAEVIHGCHGSEDHGDVHIVWAESVYGSYEYEPHEWSRDPDGPNCIKWGEDQPKKIRCYETSNVKSAHLDVLGQYRFRPGVFDGAVPYKATCQQIDGFLPDWRWEEFKGERVLLGTVHERWNYVDTNENCNWNDLPYSG